jgi:methionine aminopeptidase
MKQVAQAALGEQGITITLCMIINSVCNTVPQFSTFQEQDLMTH